MTNKIHCYLITFLTFSFLSALIHGLSATPAETKYLSLEDEKDLRRIETYFNSIKTLKARFVQTASGGNAYGTVLIQRPGKLRFQYDPPAQIMLISDGTWLTQYDGELEQASRSLIKSTPAYILVRNNIRLNRDVLVTNFQKAAGTYRVSLKDPNESDAAITLVFSMQPLKLKQWTVNIDGEQVTITLSDLKTGVRFDQELFNFVSPEWERAKQRRLN